GRQAERRTGDAKTPWRKSRRWSLPIPSTDLKRHSRIVAHSVFGRALGTFAMRAWLLRNESVSFLRRHAPEIVAEIFAEAGLGISKMAGLIYLSGMCRLHAGATNGVSGRNYATDGGRHFQTADRDQDDGLGGQRDRGLRSDGAALSRCRVSRERHSCIRPQ